MSLKKENVKVLFLYVNLLTVSKSLGGLSMSGTDIMDETKKLFLVQTMQEISARNMKMAVRDVR